MTLSYYPQASGDMDIPSDEEHIMEEGDHVEDVAGELELWENENELEEDNTEFCNSEFYKWRKHNSFQSPLDEEYTLPLLENQYPLLVNKSEFEIWQEVFDGDIWKLLMKQTRLYATRDKGLFDFKLSDEDMAKFLGIILLSGYHSLPSERCY